jgi:hypothetical protein
MERAVDRMKPMNSAEAEDIRPLLRFAGEHNHAAAKQIIAAMRTAGHWYVRKKSHARRPELWRLTDHWINAHFRCVPLDASECRWGLPEYRHKWVLARLWLELSEGEHGLRVIDDRTARLV